MRDSFRIGLAGLVVEMRPRNREVRAWCGPYVLASDAPAAARVPDLCIAPTREDIAFERSLAEADPASRGADLPDARLETLAMLRTLAAWLPAHDRLLMHAAVLEYQGEAYAFTARSGTGKSTHLRLWRRYLGAEVQVVNGDKPIVAFPPADAPDPRPVAYGTPWAGKEGWSRNVGVPLAGLCFLSRSAPGGSRIRPLAPADALDRAIHQVYHPESADGMGHTLELLDALLARVPLFDLACDMSEDAVRTSFEALTGLSFARHCVHI